MHFLSLDQRTTSMGSKRVRSSVSSSFLHVIEYLTDDRSCLTTQLAVAMCSVQVYCCSREVRNLVACSDI